MSSRNNLYYNADRVPSPHSFGGYSNMKRTLKPSEDPSFFTTEFDRGVVGPGDGGYVGPGEGDMHPGVGVGVGDPSRGMSSYHTALQHVQDPTQMQLSHHQAHQIPHHAQHQHPHTLTHAQHAPHPPQPPPQQQTQHHPQQPPPQHSQHQQQPNPQQQPSQQQQQQLNQSMATQAIAPTPPNPKKRQRAPGKGSQGGGQTTPSAQTGGPSGPTASPAKRTRTNTAWTQAEEQLLKTMRDAGSSWSDIAKSFPTRTEGSVKKHWYKDMHWAEFGEEEVFPPHATRNAKFRQKQFRTKEADINASSSQSALLLAAIKEYDQNKWKAIGLKLNKPAKACEAYAKEHFGNKL